MLFSPWHFAQFICTSSLPGPSGSTTTWPRPWASGGRTETRSATNIRARNSPFRIIPPGEMLPDTARVGGRHRRSCLASESFTELIRILQYAVGSPLPVRVKIFLRAAPDVLVGGVFAPRLGPRQEKPLLRREAVDGGLRTLPGQHFHQRIVGDVDARVVGHVLAERQVAIELGVANHRIGTVLR